MFPPVTKNSKLPQFFVLSSESCIFRNNMRPSYKGQMLPSLELQKLDRIFL